MEATADGEVPPRVEPWLRGTLGHLPPVERAVVHALQLAREDVEHWGARLEEDEVFARPFGITPFGFHVRHLTHSLDRLLTYAEGGQLNVVQRAALGHEGDDGMSRAALLGEFQAGLADALARLHALPLHALEERREVGSKRLPTTLGGLVVHLADHTQRHAGQAVTTAKLLVALRR